jgi:hypothetical protein
MTNDTIRNKNLYKIFLSIIKFLPITLALIQMLGLYLNAIGITSSVLACFGGASFLFIGLLFIMSYIFRFCYLYRIPLWYITIIGILNLLRYFGLIPIPLETLYRIYAFISGTCISLFVGFMYNNRKNPKIDHIKQLCENYAECCK